MVAWWQRRSRRTKGRLIFYPGVGPVGRRLPCFRDGHARPEPSRATARARAGTREARGPAARRRHWRWSLNAAIGARAQPARSSVPSGMIESSLRDDGYAVTRLPYASDGVTVANLEAVLAGGGKAREVVVVGAHYDTAAGGPGADDNASGVASMLAIARALSASKHAARADHSFRRVRQRGAAVLLERGDGQPRLREGLQGAGRRDRRDAQPRDARLLP